MKQVQKIDAFKALDEVLTEEDKTYLETMDKDEFLTEAHFGLGLWVRNNWIYNDSEFADPFQEKGPLSIPGGDYLSSKILEEYYDYKQSLKE